MRGFFLLMVAVLFAGCGLLPKKEKTPEETPLPESQETQKAPMQETQAQQRETQAFLGTVSTVNDLGKFVLVDFGGFAAPRPGDELEVRRAGVPVATLRAGAEMRRPFAAADILMGAPLAGDDVWSKKLTP